MKKTAYILLILVLVIIRPAFSQCEEYEYLKEQGLLSDTSYFVKARRFVGYIFPEGYHGDLVDKNKTTFRLSENEIVLIESVLITQYNEVHLKDSRVIEYRRKRNVGRFLNKYDRQYLGYFSDTGEKWCVVLLANRKRRGKHYFECFDRMMSFGFGEFYEKNQRYFRIDIENESLIMP